eukprot:Skav211755  [mRNA]  locus=scaffold674:38559:42268:+ [translate_table: standard]
MTRINRTTIASNHCRDALVARLRSHVAFALILVVAPRHRSLAKALNGITKPWSDSGNSLMVVLLFRLWEGNALVQCGHDGPFVGDKCICGGTLPYICWISESILAEAAIRQLYVATAKMAQLQGSKWYCWLLLALCPSVEGILLLFAWQRRTDWLAGALSSCYLFLAVAWLQCLEAGASMAIHG